MLISMESSSKFRRRIVSERPFFHTHRRRAGITLDHEAALGREDAGRIKLVVCYFYSHL